MTDKHKIAERVCTPRELSIWKLDDAGYSDRRISLALNLSRWTVRDHLANAKRKIREAEEDAA